MLIRRLQRKKRTLQVYNVTEYYIGENRITAHCLEEVKE